MICLLIHHIHLTVTTFDSSEFHYTVYLRYNSRIGWVTGLKQFRNTWQTSCDISCTTRRTRDFRDDITRFDALTKRVVDQYGTYEPLPGKKVNGDLTLGENMADLAGATIAYDAYKLSLAGKPAKALNGFNDDQRFFLGFSQIWRSKYRDDAIRQQVVSDPHSPAQFRVIGTLRNVDAWYDAWGVKPGDKWYVKPEDRVRIW